MFTADEHEIKYILNKLKATAPDIHNKIFGSGGGDNVRKRQASLISHCKEALRVLTSKGVNLGKKEKSIIRTALVIDYLVRNVRNDSNTKMYFQSSIPMAVLIDMFKLKKIKKRELEQMQDVLGSCLAETAIATKINKTNSSKEQTTRSLRKHNADGTAISSNSAAPTETKVSQSGLIQDLCINLGPLIPDAEFVFKYATKLFDALSNNVGNNKKSKMSDSRQRHERNFLRQDMARCLECYEGACFYLAVKESEGANYNDVLKKKASAKLSLKNQQKREDVKKKNEDGPKNNNNNGDQDDEDDQDEEDDTDDDRPMNEMDVVMAACLSERTFRTVLAHVKKYAQDFEITLDDITDQKQPAKKQRNVAMKNEMTGQNFGGQSVIVEGDICSWKSRRLSKNNAQFEKWKQNILNAAITKKQEESGDKSMSRKDALKCAADEVIRDLQKS